MSIKNTAKYYQKPRLIELVPIGIGVLLLLAIVIFLFIRPNVHPELLFDDWMAFVDFDSFSIPPYLSAMLTISIVLWVSGGAFALIGALILLGNQADRLQVAGFLGGLAVIGIYLGLDDSLRIHENLIPFYLGIGENFVMFTYIVLFALFVIRYRKAILAHHTIYFIAFVWLFGSAQLVDFFRDNVIEPALILPLTSDPKLVILEEGLKFLALVFFACYCLYYSMHEIKQVTNRTEVDSTRQTA